MMWFPPWAAWSLAGGEDKHTCDKCHEVTNKGIHTYRCTPKRKKKQTGEVTQPPRVRHADSRAPGQRARWHRETQGAAGLRGGGHRALNRDAGGAFPVEGEVLGEAQGQGEALRARGQVRLSISHSWGQGLL